MGIHLVGQPVGTEQDPVTRAEVELPHVRLDLGGHAEGPGEDVALGVDGRLGLGHLAMAHPLLGQAVVVGHLDHLPVGEHVGPGVAHVGQGQHVLAVSPSDQGDRSERGSHPPEILVGQALAPDSSVRLGEGLAQTGRAGGALEGLLEGLDRHPRRHLSPDMTTHAVGDGKEVRTLERDILVHGADAPDVRRRARTQHGHRATSKTVEPIWSRSPFPKRMAWEICSELTYVPLVEPRSSTQSWSLCRNKRACNVEV